MHNLFRIVLTTIAFLLLINIPSFADSISNEEVDKNMDTIAFESAEKYTSQDLYAINKKLVEAHPDILELEIIGYSYDQQPIYVIRLGHTELIKDNFIHSMHGLIESGTHAREVGNPVLTSKILEDYVYDYYDDTYITDMNVAELLESSTLHFIINSNPDGYNLSKFGKYAMQTEYGYTLLLNVNDTDYSNYKANIRGVDLNRNFPDTYFDIELGEWVNKWSTKTNQYNASEPSGAFYFGPYPGSEKETQTLMSYLLSYDFRYYLSFHSKGEVIYGNFAYLTEADQAFIHEYRALASQVTGYDIPPYYESDSSSGYMTDFVVNNTLKPGITIETIPYDVTLPFITSEHLDQAYQDTYSLPYLFMKKALEEGYFNYRLYKDGTYVRDFKNADYAEAIAKRDNGVVVYDTEPMPYLYTSSTVSKEEFLNRILTTLLTEPQWTDEIHFVDTDHPITNTAKTLGIVSGFEGKYYPNDDILTVEAATIIYRTHMYLSPEMLEQEAIPSYSISEQVPVWATEPVNFCIYKGYFSENTDFNSALCRDEYIKLLKKIDG